MASTPPSPLKPAQKTRLKILQAAAEEFSAQGYSGATTRAIAAAAGVSELTLFRHFKTKKALFMAVITQFSPLHSLEEEFSGQLRGSLQEDLFQVGFTFLKVINERRKGILMTLSEAQRMPELREMSADIPTRMREMLAGYLQHQMELGHIREMDPHNAAQAFLGMFFAYNISRSFAPAQSPPPESLEETTRCFVDIFIQGVQNS